MRMIDWINERLNAGIQERSCTKGTNGLHVHKRIWKVSHWWVWFRCICYKYFIVHDELRPPYIINTKPHQIVSGKHKSRRKLRNVINRHKIACGKDISIVCVHVLKSARWVFCSWLGVFVQERIKCYQNHSSLSAPKKGFGSKILFLRLEKLLPAWSLQRFPSSRLQLSQNTPFIKSDSFIHLLTTQGWVLYLVQHIQTFPVLASFV